MKKNYNRDLILSGNLYRAILSIALPVMVNSFLQTLYNLTDTFWLGRLGTDELAAINLVTPLQNIIVNFGSGITVAGSVLVAQFLGAKRDEDARSMANQVFGCAMIFSLTCVFVFEFATAPIVTWLGAEGNVWLYGKRYMQLVVVDMPFLYLVNIYAAIHQAQGDTVRPMFLNLLGIAINMILDPLFMVVYHFGVAGAALATVLAKMIPAIIAFVLLSRKTELIYLDVRRIRFEKDKLRDIVVIGLPTAMGGSIMQFGFLLMTRNTLSYGTEAMAAYGIGNKINGLISLPANGMGSAVSTIVGQNVGAKQYERAEKGYVLSRRMIVAFLAVGGVILSRPIVSSSIASIFTADQAVVAMASDYLSLMALWTFTNGIQTTTMGLFQGSGHTEVTMAMDISRLWIFRFATLYICETMLHMGVRSIWYSVVISNAISPFILFIIYKTGYWKRQRSRA